jgi:hypothetical protein
MTLDRRGNVRLEEDRLCVLVMVGVRLDGTKELVAIRDGYRESKESWADLLRDLKRRGMRAPVLAVGDGALGFWAAVRDVWPETRHQHDWWHKTANVLDTLPQSAQPTAKKMLAEIRDAEDRHHALAATKTFANEFAPKWPNAVAKITDDLDVLLTFYDFPAEHWIHLRRRTRSSRPSRPSGCAPADQGTRIARGGTRDGLQAHHRRARPLARHQRAAPRRTRARRRDLQERSTHRKPEPGRRVTDKPDPQVLTISPRCRPWCGSALADERTLRFNGSSGYSQRLGAAPVVGDSVSTSMVSLSRRSGRQSVFHCA